MHLTALTLAFTALKGIAALAILTGVLYSAGSAVLIVRSTFAK